MADLAVFKLTGTEITNRKTTSTWMQEKTLFLILNPSSPNY